MLLKELRIERPHSWGSEAPKPLQGTVTIAGTQGELKLTLSPQAIGQILSIVAAEAGVTARTAASQVQSACTSASHEHVLLGELEPVTL